MHFNMTNTDNPRRKKKNAKDQNGYLVQEGIQVGIRPIKRCSASVIIRSKSKVQWRIPSNRSEWPSSERSTKIKCCKGQAESGILPQSWWEAKLVQQTWKTAWMFLTKLQHPETVQSSNPTSGLRSRKKKSCFKITHAFLFSGQHNAHWPRHKIRQNVPWQENEGRSLCAGIRLTHRAERNKAAASSLDGPSDSGTKWRKSEKDSYHITMTGGSGCSHKRTNLHNRARLWNGVKKLMCESCSVVSDSLRPQGLYSPRDSPGQNTRVGGLSLL